MVVWSIEHLEGKTVYLCSIKHALDKQHVSVHRPFPTLMATWGLLYGWMAVWSIECLGIAVHLPHEQRHLREKIDHFVKMVDILSEE